jgi:hypothetical protein
MRPPAFDLGGFVFQALHKGSVAIAVGSPHSLVSDD